MCPGKKYVSQYCANSTSEVWWAGDGEPCRYGDQGGYQCGCSFTGCNYDEVTAGYVSMEDRFAKIMMGLFIAVMLGVTVVFCCSCCCHRAKNKKPSPQQFQQQNGQPRKKASPLTRVAIVVGFVAACYIISFFVKGGSNKNPKYDSWRGRGRGRGQDDASVDVNIPPPVIPTTEPVISSTTTLPSTTSTIPTTSTSTTEAMRTWGYDGKGII